MNAFGVVAEFERRVAEYAGAEHAVAVDCCTSAIFLSLKYEQARRLWLGLNSVTLPARTYVSVPMACIHAGFKVQFDDYAWSGIYPIAPFVIFDGAKRFRRNMYRGGFHCLSFHTKKILAIGRGGMILTNDEHAVRWLRRARYDGREGKPYPEESIGMLGWHCYMTPEQAARGLQILDFLPDDNADQTEDYPDLRKFKVFSTVTEEGIA